MFEKHIPLSLALSGWQLGTKPHPTENVLCNQRWKQAHRVTSSQQAKGWRGGSHPLCEASMPSCKLGNSPGHPGAALGIWLVSRAPSPGFDSDSVSGSCGGVCLLRLRALCPGGATTPEPGSNFFLRRPAGMLPADSPDWPDSASLLPSLETGCFPRRDRTYPRSLFKALPGIRAAGYQLPLLQRNAGMRTRELQGFDVLGEAHTQALWEMMD